MSDRTSAVRTPPRRPGALRSTIALALMLLVPLTVGGLGSMATADEVDGWYARADVAPWTPPDAVFGPVWTTLYVMMGLAAWMIWRRLDAPGRASALRVYVLQLVLNSVWSPLFFGGRPLWGDAALWAAFVLILMLIAAVVVTLTRFRRIDRLAAVLLLPCLLWIVYASTLNAYLAAMN